MHSLSSLFIALAAFGVAQQQHGHATPSGNQLSDNLESQQHFDNSQPGQQRFHQQQMQSDPQLGDYQALRPLQGSSGGQDDWSTPGNPHSNQDFRNQQQYNHQNGDGRGWDLQRSQQGAAFQNNAEGSFRGHAGGTARSGILGQSTGGSNEGAQRLPLNFNTAASNEDEHYEQNDIQLGKLNTYSTKASHIVFVKNLGVELDLDSVVCQVFRDVDGHEQVGNTFSNTQDCDLGDDPIGIESIKCWSP